MLKTAGVDGGVHACQRTGVFQLDFQLVVVLSVLSSAVRGKEARNIRCNCCTQATSPVCFAGTGRKQPFTEELAGNPHRSTGHRHRPFPHCYSCDTCFPK